MYLLIFFLFILLMILIPEKSSSKRKGIEGEKLVIKKLSRLSKKYTVLNDLLIENNKKTSQIDHIVISEDGIFIIETKNYSGKIYINYEEKYWTQKLNSYKNNFYNPVWQNRAHIRAVQNKLKEIDWVPMYSIIVFCGKCKVKNIKKYDEVIYLKELNRYIRNVNSDRKLTIDEKVKIKEVLERSNIKSVIKRRKHVNSIKKYT